MSTADKLTELANEAAETLRTAISIIIHVPAVNEAQVSMRNQALRDAVAAQAVYAQASAICPQCGHYGVEHDEAAALRGEPCGCCVRVDKAKAEVC